VLFDRSRSRAVVRSMPTLTMQRQCTFGQHALADVEGEACTRKRESILRRAAIGPSPVHEVLPTVHEALRSPGQPLDTTTRAFMEPRFSHDFSRVRVHTDEKAAKSAQAMGALAYAIGQDVVFGAGEYAPETVAGEMLLAHELSHVTQTRGQANSIHCWFTRNRLPLDYTFISRPRTIPRGFAHEDITESVLKKPDFAARFPFGAGARDRLAGRSGYLDAYKEVLRQRMHRGEITEDEFKVWESDNHGFTKGAGELKRDFYLNWAIGLANQENNLGIALDKLGDALHVAQDMNAHLFTAAGCSLQRVGPRPTGCSEAQDDPGINPQGFGHAFIDTWGVLQQFYEGLMPERRMTLSSF
jgi:hypothetical protein